MRWFFRRRPPAPPAPPPAPDDEEDLAASERERAEALLQLRALEATLEVIARRPLKE